MKPESIGEVIATRTLLLLRDQAAPAEVIVLLGKPQHGPDRQELSASLGVRYETLVILC
jgi:hypothetical protein